ncbi:hypothetical protein HII36_04010 [Nonomuraea sp. NN258]|uniref:hypothetical protein n=1 Tax=Nonomuraea antri TaxID=2730852 RepID=UPI00156906F3|nr:hypothetical protein [Nonomuraea antri]NRQ30999.1 hypothetical protein [Nonomuraea antri]
MLSTETPPLPGARAVAALRAGARSARRTALTTLCVSLALLSSAQVLADRAPTREETLPLAVLALVVFVLALPTLALTQAIWGLRMRAVRRRERELYAVPPRERGRTAGRLGMAAGWALVVLLGGTLPRLFRDAAAYGIAAALTWATEVLTLATAAAGVSFLLWWARDALGMLARARRSGGSPGDPWDPGRGTRPRGGAALWTGAAVAVAALLGARAHLWEPATGVIYALLTAALVLGVVTGE